MHCSKPKWPSNFHRRRFDSIKEDCARAGAWRCETDSECPSPASFHPPATKYFPSQYHPRENPNVSDVCHDTTTDQKQQLAPTWWERVFRKLENDPIFLVEIMVQIGLIESFSSTEIRLALTVVWRLDFSTECWLPSMIKDNKNDSTFSNELLFLHYFLPCHASWRTNEICFKWCTCNSREVSTKLKESQKIDLSSLPSKTK